MFIDSNPDITKMAFIMKHKVLLPLILIFAISYTNAQNVGIGTSSPAALLDVTATNNGVLIPRVALTGTGSASPLTSPATSTLVYNTATVSNVTPGFYYWNGTAWVRFIDNGSLSGATTVSNTSSANTLSTTVDGVTGTTVPIVNSIGNTSSANTLSTTVNGVTGSTVPIVNSVSNTSSVNTLSTTVNGVTGTGVNIINSNVLGMSGNNLTATINGIGSSAQSLAGLSIAGDVTGTLAGSTVARIQGQPVSATTPTAGQVLEYSSGTWTPTPPGSALFTAGTGLSWSSSTLNSVWTTSGTTIYNNNSGSIGVGNSSPNFKLDVEQDITMSNDINPGTAQLSVAGATAPGKRMIMGYDVNGNGFGFIKAGYYQNAWTILSLQPNGGTVGIGTTSPAATLDISTGNLRVGSLTASSAVYTDASKILTSTAPTAGTIGYWQRNGTTLAPATITDGVGIGTTTINASNKLDVIGGGLLIGASDVHADAALFIISSYGGFDRLTQMVPSVASKPALNIMASTDATNTGQWWAWGVNSNLWSIQPGTSFSGSTGLFMNTSGNVGIGTTTPGGKLEVVGGALRLSNAYLDVNRSGYLANGISWYAQSFPAWSTYMSPGGQTTTGPHGDLTAPSGTYVTSWALRNYIENNAGYGWTFESAANTTTPSVKFEIRSSDGLFHSTGNAIVDGVVYAGASAVMGTGIAGGYYQDVTNGAYRSIVSSATTNGYYFQTNTGATTTMYVGLGGAYNGNVGIGTLTPSQSLEIMGNTLCHGLHYQKTSDGQGSGAHGISWYDPSFTTWFDYMAPAGGTNAPSGTAAPSDATSGVTSWARRFNIESVAGYGWIFESGVQGAGNAPTVKFSINSNNGNIHATGACTALSFATSSDIRYKKYITPLENSLEKVSQMQGVYYYWKMKEFPGKFNDKRQIGFIAQDLEKLYPELVLTGEDGYKSVDYSKVTPILVEAIKDLEKKIGDVEAQNEQLKSENKSLKQLTGSLQSAKADASDVNELKLQIEELKKLMLENGMRVDK
jgi:hypothetical protein